MARYRKLEMAKHHLFYTMIKLKLPLKNRIDDPEGGLAFDFLSDQVDANGNVTAVLTGHDEGLITINVAEADDAEREKRRTQMGEPYRTLLGHFRHEIGHYFWDKLVRDQRRGSSGEVPRGLRRRAGGLRRGAAAALQHRRPARLAEQLRQHLRHRPSVGRLRGDLGALPAHRRYLGNRPLLRP